MTSSAVGFDFTGGNLILQAIRTGKLRVVNRRLARELFFAVSSRLP